jgi:hypothetical protein
MEIRDLIQMFDIRYTDGKSMYVCSCYPDILSELLKQLMQTGNRIEQVNSKWM